MLVLLLSSNAFTSGPDYGPNEWGNWDLKTHPGYCELQSVHKAINPPYYPDIYFRFHVPIKWRDGRHTLADRGILRTWLYVYSPNVPKENRPLHGIEAATLGGIHMKPKVSKHEDTYTFFEMDAEQSIAVFEQFRSAAWQTGFVRLFLHLSNGEMVAKEVPPGHYFNTQARMLAVCMAEGFSH